MALGLARKAVGGREGGYHPCVDPLRRLLVAQGILAAHADPDARAHADATNTQAYSVLLAQAGAGPNLLNDGRPVFQTAYAKVASVGAAVSVTTVGAGRAALMKQTTLDGQIANIRPRILLCGPDIITAVEQFLTAITPAQQSNAIPESLRQIVPVADANPGSSVAWYLFGDPATAPVFAYSLLEGFEGPRLSSEEVFGVQGMRVKLEHDFGVGAIDFRGAYRNGGA
jgi:hypothetical protein